MCVYVQTHQVSRDELSGVALPQRPTVGQVGDGGPERHVVRVIIVPAGERVFDEVHKGLVGVVVQCVPVDVTDHEPGLRQHHGLVEVDPLEGAPFDPKGLHAAECRLIELLEAEGVVTHAERPDGHGWINDEEDGEGQGRRMANKLSGTQSYTRRIKKVHQFTSRKTNKTTKQNPTKWQKEKRKKKERKRRKNKTITPG